jgi:hypothetical protein
MLYLQYNNKMNNQEINNQLNELFKQTQQVKEFNFASFYGYLQGTLIGKDVISKNDFVKAAEYGLKMSTK